VKAERESCTAEQLRAKAQSLSDLVNGLPNGPAEWINQTRMTIWALTVSAVLVEQVDDAIRNTAKARGIQILPSVLSQLRLQAVETFLAKEEQN
jgi:hypothetical protein